LVQRRAAAACFQAEAGVEATAASFEVASSFEAGVAGVEEPRAAVEVKEEAAGAVNLSRKSVLVGRGEMRLGSHDPYGFWAESGDGGQVFGLSSALPSRKARFELLTRAGLEGFFEVSPAVPR
jgi:hypothetical protein